jgi:hypothetical protein
MVKEELKPGQLVRVCATFSHRYGDLALFLYLSTSTVGETIFVRYLSDGVVDWWYENHIEVGPGDE